MKNLKPFFTILYLSAIIIGYTVIFSVLTILRHDTLQTGIYDLGLFDQALWNIIHGRPAVTEYIPWAHFSPILIFIAPLYWIWCSPKILLIFQGFSLAIGAIPLYLLAQKRLNDTKLALSLSTAYLLSLHLHGVNLFDFHTIALVVPLVLFAFYFLETEKYILFASFLIFSFMCREEMLLVGFMIGLYIAIVKRKIKMGISISALSIISFLIIIYYIIPYLGGEPYLYLSFKYKYYKLDNKTLYEIIKVIFIPHKLKYILSFLLPLMGFPILSGWGLLLAIPQTAGVLLSSYRTLFTIGFYQYPAPIIPFIFILTVYGISNFNKFSFLKNKKTKSAFSHIVTSYFIIIGVIFNFLWFSKYFRIDKYKITEHHRLIHKIKKTIPQDVPLTANNRIGAHFSQRREIYNFENLAECPYGTGKKTDCITDYIIVDAKTLCDYAVSKLREILSERVYGVMYYEDGYIILKRGYDPSLNEKIFNSH